MFSILAAEEPAQQYLLGIGAPCVDIIVNVDDTILQKLSIEKGSSTLADWSTFSTILNACHNKPTRHAAGGSCANTIKGLARLGANTLLANKIGQDAPGTFFLQKMAEAGVNTHLLPSEQPTAQVVALVTPDGQRTMRCFPGSSTEFCDDDLFPELFQNVSLVHFDGYMLYNGNVVESAMKMAKEAGCKVSIDLGSRDLIKTFRSRYNDMLENYVDIVFANNDEAFVMTGLDDEHACLALAEKCPVAVVMLGKDGCLVGSNGIVIRTSGNPSRMVDTTGAGDLFACGFLYGYVNGLPLERCAEYGNITGCAVVEVIGTDISEEKWEHIRKQFHTTPK